MTFTSGQELNFEGPASIVTINTGIAISLELNNLQHKYHACLRLIRQLELETRLKREHYSMPDCSRIY